MKLTRSGIVAVAIAAAFFAGSVVAMATAGDNGGAQTSKKKKVKRGPAGPPGPANIVMREVQGPNVPNGSVSATVTASCLPGEKAVGGGLIWNTTTVEGMRVAESYPPLNTPVTSWSAVAENNSGADKTFRVRVLCAQS